MQALLGGPQILLQLLVVGHTTIPLLHQCFQLHITSLLGWERCFSYLAAARCLARLDTCLKRLHGTQNVIKVHEGSHGVSPMAPWPYRKEWSCNQNFMKFRKYGQARASQHNVFNSDQSLKLQSSQYSETLQRRPLRCKLLYEPHFNAPGDK